MASQMRSISSGGGSRSPTINGPTERIQSALLETSERTIAQ